MRTHMKTAPLFRRLLACWVAISVAAAGISPGCEAAAVGAGVSQRCCCGCPAECRCGDACGCMAGRPTPVGPAVPEKADDLRLVLGLNASTAPAAAPSPAVGRGPARPPTTLAPFPSLRALEVRIQT